MRGEHDVRVSSMRLITGSSPHARGALHMYVQLMKACGIIPACAGSTPYDLLDNSACGDHPRMRGEHVT